jgi:hypothetical protein
LSPRRALSTRSCTRSPAGTRSPTTTPASECRAGVNPRFSAVCSRMFPSPSCRRTQPLVYGPIYCGVTGREGRPSSTPSCGSAPGPDGAAARVRSRWPHGRFWGSTTGDARHRPVERTRVRHSEGDPPPNGGAQSRSQRPMRHTWTSIPPIVNRRGRRSSSLPLIGGDP